MSEGDDEKGGAMAKPWTRKREEEARAVAEAVLAGQSRSYVRAAVQLSLDFVAYQREVRRVLSEIAAADDQPSPALRPETREAVRRLLGLD